MSGPHRIELAAGVLIVLERRSPFRFIAPFQALNLVPVLFAMRLLAG